MAFLCAWAVESTYPDGNSGFVFIVRMVVSMLRNGSIVAS